MHGHPNFIAQWGAWLGIAGWLLLMYALSVWFSRRTCRRVAAVSVLALLVALTLTGARTAPSNKAFGVGVAALWRALLAPAFPEGGIRPPGALAYTLLVVAGLLLYRWTDTWAARVEMPTLRVCRPDGGSGQPPGGAAAGGTPAAVASPPPQSSDGSDHAVQVHRQIAEELEFRLPAVRVPRPSTAFGGSTNDLIAAVVAVMPQQADASPAVKVFDTAVRALNALWPRTPSYEVRFYLELESAASDGPSLDGPGPATRELWRATVDIRDVGNDSSALVSTLAPAPVHELAERIAAFAAAYVFRRDRAMPVWARWAPDGAGLAEYLLAQQQRRDLEGQAPDKAEEALRAQWADRAAWLEWASRASPDNAVVRHDLAILYDSQGRHLDALYVYALNRRDFPRLFRSRYRLASSLNRLAWQLGESDAPTTSHRGCGRWADACAMLQQSYVDVAPACEPFPADLLEQLALAVRYDDAALDELGASRRHLAWWRTAAGGLRHRDERSQVVGYLRQPAELAARRRADLWAANLVRAHRLLVAERLREVRRDRLRADRHAAPGDDRWADQDRPRLDADRVRSEAERIRLVSAGDKLLGQEFRGRDWQARLNAALTLMVARRDGDFRAGTLRHHQAGRLRHEIDVSRAHAHRLRDELDKVLREPRCEIDYPSIWLERLPVYRYLRDTWGAWWPVDASRWRADVATQLDQLHRDLRERDFGPAGSGPGRPPVVLASSPQPAQPAPW